MLNFFRLSFCLLLASSLTARGDDACPTIELDQAGQMAHQIPVWDQSHHPACFAYSASLLANIWIREDWSKHSSRVKKLVLNPSLDYRSILKSSALAQILDPEKGRTCQAFDYILRHRKQRIPLLNLEQNRVPVCTMWGLDPENPGHITLKSPEVIEARMHELLTQSARPIPFAIEYCSAVFDYPERDFIVSRNFSVPLTFLADKKQALVNFSEKCGFHSAVVIGQKMRNGKCYIKVRNSFGTGDSNYPEYPKPRNPNNEHGNYWIPAKALSRNLFRIIEIVPGTVDLTPADLGLFPPFIEREL